MSEFPERLSKALADRYSIQKEIGAGGMATVYLAQDIKHNRPVALKVLRPELAAVLGGERFLTEITTTANLQHPHILPLFDSGEADGFLYYVMPYVEGESLRERLDREHQLPVEDAVALAKAVASSLDYAHRNDVIHRDIKPDNILLHDGNPVVADFGIALAVSAAGGSRMTETGLSLGTPHYMSPEQASADRELTGRSDVYSLACVLYEMLTGDPPHTGPNPQTILMRILTEEPRPITSARKAVPPNVAAAITKGLEKLPADRFESAAEFGRALGDPAFTYVSTGQISAEGETSPRHSGSVGTSPTPWLSDTRSRVALLALFVSTVFSINLLLDRGGAEGVVVDTPVTRFEVDLGDVEVPMELSISPDGSLLVFASQAPGGTRQLYLRNSADPEVRPIPGTENASEPEFSPDGNWIAFVANGTDLKRISARGGIPLAITTLLPILSAPSWGPDGSILFVGKEGLYQIPAEGGDPVQILATPLYASRLPRYVPGTKLVLFTHQLTDSTDPEVNLLDLESGEVTFLAPGRDARYLDSGHLIFASPSGSMVARPFDPARGEFSGSSIPLLDDVAISRVSGERLHFTVAQSGTAVYAVGSSNQLAETLVQVDLMGNKTAIPGIGTGNFSAPRFDPTGRYLAFEFDGAVWIRDLLLGSQNQLHAVPAYNPIWSTDGSVLAFGHGPVANGVTQILTRPSNLSSPPEVLLESEKFLAPSAWTPDGSRLVFTEFNGQDATGAEIWTVDTGAPGIPEAYLRADGWDEGFVSLSPDGGWAAYESEEGGEDAIYVMAFPDPRGKVRVSDGGGVGARWSADGRRIFYRSGDTTKAVNVRLQPTFEVLSHETLFVGPFGGISPHPDGTHFVAIERPGAAVGAANRRLYFVVNWLNEALTQLGASR